MLNAALSLIVKNWKQHRYPSMAKWINKLVTSYYRLLLDNKKNTFLGSTKFKALTICIILKGITLNEKANLTKLHTV